jgi:hypothetical protein
MRHDLEINCRLVFELECSVLLSGSVCFFKANAAALLPATSKQAPSRHTQGGWPGNLVRKSEAEEGEVAAFYHR